MIMGIPRLYSISSVQYMCNHPSHTISYSGCEPKRLGHQSGERQERVAGREGRRKRGGKSGGGGRGGRGRGRSSGKRWKFWHLEYRPCPCSVLSRSVMSFSLRPHEQRILQARILGWVVMPSSRGSSQPRDQT